jgi:hypothetical protein
MNLRDVDPDGVLNAAERRTAESLLELPGVEVSSSISSLNVAFDVVAYLQGHSEAEMFEMLGKLKDFLE